MGGKSPSIDVPAVAPAPQTPIDNTPEAKNMAAGQETDTVKKAREAAAARAAAAKTILTGPGGLDNATAIVGKQKLGQ